MVAAAAPSSAPARRGLPAAPLPAGPERRPRSRDGVGPGRRGLRGHREAGGGERQARPGLRARRPGSRGSLCLGALTALPGAPKREKGGGGGRLRARCAAEPRGP